MINLHGKLLFKKHQPSLKQYFLFFFTAFPILIFSQSLNSEDTPPKSLGAKIKKKTYSSIGSPYVYCDTDSDGFVSIHLDDIVNNELRNNIGAFNSDEGIYICTSDSNIKLVTNLNATATINDYCVQPFLRNMLDIAVSPTREIYVCSDKIYKLDANCAIQNTITIPGTNAINSLSFDRIGNLFLGGYDSKVYRLDKGNFGQTNLWHDFLDGNAAGDFIMYKDKMYIAWRGSGYNKLYEVTVDSAMNYVSHIDLGNLPNGTYGLASELGFLYGVTSNELYKINLKDMSYETVLTNTNGSAWFGAAGKNEAIDLDVKVYETNQNALNNQNPLSLTWTNTVSGGQTIYVKITNKTNNQSVLVPVKIIINEAPTYSSPVELSNCINAQNASTFNLRETESGILGAQSNIIVTYHENENNANNNILQLPDLYTLKGDSQVIYARLTNPSTGCFSVFSFLLKLKSKPDFNNPDDYVLCCSGTVIHEEINLGQFSTAILKGHNPANNTISYYKSNGDAILGSNSIQDPYFVTAPLTEVFFRIENNSGGCFDTGSFKIQAYLKDRTNPFNVKIETKDWTNDKNSIEVFVEESGKYEYSIDGINYQDKSLFENLVAGDYTIYVRNPEKCALEKKEVFLLMYPVYFTPNNDNFNDYWKINSSNSEPNMKILIYDRYGKFLKSLNPLGVGWDGTFNNELMPASDYWFVVDRQNGKQYKGHFTLKR